MSDAIRTQGTTIKRGNGASPEVFTPIAEVVSFDGPGGEAAEIDVTHLGSTAKEYLIGLRDEGTFTMEVNMIPSDPIQQALFDDRASGTSRNFKLTLVEGTVLAFAAYVKGFPWSGKANDKVSGKLTLRITGPVTRS